MYSLHLKLIHIALLSCFFENQNIQLYSFKMAMAFKMVHFFFLFSIKNSMDL